MDPLLEGMAPAFDAVTQEVSYAHARPELGPILTMDETSNGGVAGTVSYRGEWNEDYADFAYVSTIQPGSMGNSSILAATNKTSSSGIYDFYRNEQIVFLTFLFFFIVIGNVTVLIAIGLSRRGQRSRMNLFIMNLAAADLSVGVLSVLTDLIWRITMQWYAGEAMCKIVRYLQAVVTYGSTYVLVSLSIDRLEAIARPMNFTGRSYRTRLLIAFAWIFSCAFSLPMLYINNEKTLEDGTVQCWITVFTERWHWQLYMTLIAVALFIIPTVIITICYCVMLHVIWTKSRLISQNGRGAAGQSSFTRLFSTARNNGGVATDRGHIERSRMRESTTSSRGIIPQAKIRTVKMTLVIVLVFILCWSPYFIFDLLDVYGMLPRTQRKVAVAVFFQSLAPLNSLANPFIYGIFSSRICRNLRRIPLANGIMNKICCCSDDVAGRAERSGSVYSSTLQTFATSEESHRKSSRYYIGRRQSGPPCVKDSLNEKETEILMKNIGSSSNGVRAGCPPGVRTAMV